MVDIVRRVVTQMGMDSSAYARSADAVVQSNQKMVTSGQQVVDTTSRVEQRQVSSSRAIDKLEASIDKNVRAFQAYQKQLTLVQRAYDDGSISGARALEMIDKIEAYHQRATGTIKEATIAYQTLNGVVKVGTEAMREYAQQAAAARQAQKSDINQSAFNSFIGVNPNSGAGSARTSAQVFEQVALAEKQAADAQDRMTLAAQKYRDQINPILPLHRQYATDLRELNELTKAGYLTDEQRIKISKSLNDSFSLQVAGVRKMEDALKNASGAIKLTTQQSVMLGQQVQDIGISLMGGMNPIVVFAQQIPQAAYAVGGFGNLVKVALSYITPFRVGLLAAAAATTVLATRATDLEGETRAMSITLRAYGKDAEITTGQIHGLIEAMRDLGVSKQDARAAATAAASVPGATGGAVLAALLAAPDFAANYGVSAEDAAKKLTEMGTTGYAAIKKLDEAYRFLSVDQAALIRQLSEHGDKAGAVAMAYDALEAKISGAALNAMSPMKRSTNEMARSWQNLIDIVANTQPVLDAIDSLSGGFKALANVMSGDLTGAWDGWVKHVTNDPIFSLLSAAGKGWLKLGEWTSGIKNSNGPGNSPATNGTGAIGSRTFYVAPSKSNLAATTIDAETAAYDRQIAVLKEATGARQILQARLEAENQAMIAGKDAVEIKTAGDRAASVATAQLSVAANDNLATIKLQTEGTLALASAGGVSTEAGLRAQAEMQARAAKLQNVTVNVGNLTDALVEQAKATSHLQAVEDLHAATLDTNISRMKAEAALINDPSLQHQADLAITRQQKLNDVTLAYKGNVDDVNKAMSEFDRKAAYDEQVRFWDDVRQKAGEISGDITDFLVDGFVNAEKGGKSAFKDLWDGALAGAKRLIANIAAEFLKTKIIMPIVTDIIGSNASLFGIATPNGATTGVSGVSSMSQLSQLFSSTGSLSGVGSAASGAGSWLSGLFGGGSGASAATGVDAAWLAKVAPGISSGGVGGLAHSAPYVSGAGSAASSAGGAASAAYAIPVWGWVAAAAAVAKSFVEGSDPKSAKGALNTLLLPSMDEWQSNPGRSAYNAFNPVGLVARDFGAPSWLAGAFNGIDPFGEALTSLGLPSFLTPGGLIGSLLGADKKPTDAFANTAINLVTGKVGSAQFDSGEKSQQNIDASQQLANSFLQIEKQILAITGGTGPNSAFAKVGSRDGIVVGVGNGADFWKAKDGGQAGVASGTFKTPEEALSFMVSSFAKQITGITDPNVKYLLGKGGTTDEITSNLTFLSNVMAITAKNASPAAAAIKSINDQFDPLIAQSKTLGIYSSLIVTERDKEIKAVKDQVAATSLAFDRNLDMQSATLQGRDRDALSIQLEMQKADQLASGKSLLDQQIITADQFQRLSNILDQQVVRSLTDFDNQMKEAGAGLSNSAIGNLTNFAMGLVSSDLSPLNAQQKGAYAADQFSRTADLARQNDITAIGNIPAAAQAYLESQRTLYGSGSQYVEAFNSVRAVLEQISNQDANALIEKAIVVETRTQTQALVASIDDLKKAVQALGDSANMDANKPAQAA